MEFAGRKIAAGESKTANAERKMDFTGFQAIPGPPAYAFRSRRWLNPHSSPIPAEDIRGLF